MDKRETHQPQNSQSGVSLIGAIIGLIVTSFVILILSQAVTRGLSGQKKVERDSELTYIRQTIFNSIDCTATLDKARGGMTLQDFCNASSSSESGLLNSNPILIYVKTFSGSVKPLTSPLSSQHEKSGKIGDWWIRAGCDWANQSLVVRAVRYKPDGGFAEDPMTKETLSFSNSNPKLKLFGGLPGDRPLCLVGNSGVLKGFETRAMYSYEVLTIQVPVGTAYTEITSEGENQGKDDTGADTAFTRIIVDHQNRKYSGTQMVELGSADKNGLAYYWNPTEIGKSPLLQGFTNPKMSYNVRTQKIPNPKIDAPGSLPQAPIQQLKFSRPLIDSNNNKRYWVHSVMIKHY